MAIANIHCSDFSIDTASALILNLYVYEKYLQGQAVRSTNMKWLMAKEHVLEHSKKKISIVGFAKLGKLLSLTAVRLTYRGTTAQT